MQEVGVRNNSVFMWSKNICNCFCFIRTMYLILKAARFGSVSMYFVTKTPEPELCTLINMARHALASLTRQG